jgi:hypothetical protein
MKIRQLSGIYFREDDTFVVVFAFVHLAERGNQPQQIVLPRKQIPGHSHRISFSRGAHEAAAWGSGAFRSTGSRFSCQVSGQPRLRAFRTISEH